MPPNPINSLLVVLTNKKEGEVKCQGTFFSGSGGKRLVLENWFKVS